MQKEKKVKKEKPLKTQLERAAIVKALKERIRSTVGIDIDLLDMEGIIKFRVILDEYANSPHLVSGFTGKIYVSDIQRYFNYILPIGKHANEQVYLSAS